MIESTEDYKGYQIEIRHDEDAPNPFTDWDGEPPILVAHNGRSWEYSEYGLSDSPPDLTREQIKANLSDILRMLEAKNIFQVRQLASCDQIEFDSVEELINDAIFTTLEDMHTRDRLNAFVDLYTMTGVTAVCKEVHGFSQGDFALVLAVASDDWFKTTGAPRDSAQRQLENAIKLYEAWVFGNVHGYAVIHPEYGELDSCWGFYGDPDESGLLQEARASIDYDIDYRRGEDRKEKARALAHRLNRVKAWVRHGVPLSVRQKESLNF